MTVFPFPPDFPGLSVPFSVVGFDWDSGAPDGELLILPSGCEAPPFGLSLIHICPCRKRS